MKKIIVLCVSIFICNPSFASKISLESIHVEKEFPNAWTIVGKIRNMEKVSIKGSVKIKLLDKSGDITKSFRANVNDGDPIAPGQAAPFHYTARPKAFSKFSKATVLFVDRRR